MSISLNLDKFWGFIKEWSVGRMIILLMILAWIIFCLKSVKCIDQSFLFNILLVAVFLEIFELSHNKLEKIDKKLEKINDKLVKVDDTFKKLIYSISMIISLLSIIGFSIIFLFKLYY